MPKKSKKRAMLESQLQSQPPDEQPTSPDNPLRLAVFDLDYTIWQPEMYQLSGPGPKLTLADSKYNKELSAGVLSEARTCKDGFILTDGRNTPMRVFPGA